MSRQLLIILLNCNLIFFNINNLLDIATFEKYFIHC